jgi:hypothetical protein
MAVIFGEDLKDGGKEVNYTQGPYLGRDCSSDIL